MRQIELAKIIYLRAITYEPITLRLTRSLKCDSVSVSTIQKILHKIVSDDK